MSSHPVVKGSGTLITRHLPARYRCSSWLTTEFSAGDITGWPKKYTCTFKINKRKHLQARSYTLSPRMRCCAPYFMHLQKEVFFHFLSLSCTTRHGNSKKMLVWSSSPHLSSYCCTSCRSDQLAFLAELFLTKTCTLTTLTPFRSFFFYTSKLSCF